MLESDKKFIEEIDKKINEIEKEIRLEKRILYISFFIIISAEIAALGKSIYDNYEQTSYIEEEKDNSLNSMYEKAMNVCHDFISKEKVKTKK